VPHAIEITCPQWFFGLVIKENQVTLIVLMGRDILIILKLNTSFILFDICRGISMPLIEVLQVHKVFFKIGCVR
jgi:hypothetical protein